MMTLLAMAVVAMADVGPYLNGYAIDTFITPGRWTVWAGMPPSIRADRFLSVCVFTFIQNAGYVEANICHDIRRTASTGRRSCPSPTMTGRWSGTSARMTSDSSRLADTVAWSLGPVLGLRLYGDIVASMFV